ncbi:MAG: hypothetical protein JXA57_11965 [Armatimonadetes bacterium]|nr:hypothetical protein [Armatimonadota bacterium]
MTFRKIALLAGLLACGSLLAGCPGMPGMPGGQEQQMPPGILPPPGLESGGVRTLMGSTVTPPDNAYLLVSFSLRDGDLPSGGTWQTARRVIPLESCVLVEGLNYDGRAEDVAKDVNQLVPYEHLVSFQWRYEERPAPPPAPAAAGESSAEKEGD